jgi:flagellar hook assembly protein FlgD
VGTHTAIIKAWDVLNNSNTASVDFVVSANSEAKMDRVLNYPNPFTTTTSFEFDHNQSNETMYITIEIYSVKGTLVKSIRSVNTGESSRVTDIEWDGKDELGNKIGRGVYLYKCYYKTASGKSTSKYQKLVIL